MKSGYPSKIGKGTKEGPTALSGESGQDQRLFARRACPLKLKTVTIFFKTNPVKSNIDFKKNRCRIIYLIVYRRIFR
jgi:hypothetical protein